MKFKKIISISLILSMLMMSLNACSSSSSSSSDSKVIKIGVFEPQTGENGGGGFQEVLGARFANSLYKTITINGEEYTIELDEVDNKSDKTEAVNAAQKLVSDRVSGVIGSYGSGVSIAAGEIFSDAKIPAIGGSCTNPQVTNGNEYYFRVCFLDPFQGTVMANYAKKHGYDKVAVITQLGDDYSEGLGGFFVKACEQYGIEVVAQEKFQTNAQDFRAILSNIKAQNPSFIFAPSSITTAPLILKQAREIGIECKIGAGDTWENGTIIDNAGADAEGFICSTFYDENGNLTSEGEKFINGFKDFLEKNNQPRDIPAVSALGYDAYLAFYKAIEQCQSTKGEDIKNALKTLNFVGVTGNISFDENGDAQKDGAYIKEVQNGKFVFVDFAEAK